METTRPLRTLDRTLSVTRVTCSFDTQPRERPSDDRDARTCEPASRPRGWREGWDAT